MDFKPSIQATRQFILFLFLTTLLSCAPPHGKIGKTRDLGKWDTAAIDQLLNDAGRIDDPGEKVAFLSAPFLSTPYRANTLIGSAEIPEIFVLRLDRVDCFTFLDYIEALRRSSNFHEFVNNLRQVRYQQGQLDFLSRNHFFSLWGNAPLAPLHDVTAQVGGEKTRWTTKYLNQNKEGDLFLPGYPVKKQTIAFIPGEEIDATILSRLHTGDYIGIYSPNPGLDVSHTGIVIKKGGTTFLRHASSKWLRKRVRDVELLPYLAGEKGLIIYRAQRINYPLSQ
jgi:hypothetical protein